MPDFQTYIYRCITAGTPIDTSITLVPEGLSVSTDSTVDNNTYLPCRYPRIDWVSVVDDIDPVHIDPARIVSNYDTIRLYRDLCSALGMDINKYRLDIRTEASQDD